MRHSRRSKLPTSDLTFCSGAATSTRRAARACEKLCRYSRTENPDETLVAGGELEVKSSAKGGGVGSTLPTGAKTLSNARFFFMPAERLLLLPTFFQTAPEISPCLQMPNAARSRETARDVRQKLKAVLHSRAAREGSGRTGRNGLFCLDLRRCWKVFL